MVDTVKNIFLCVCKILVVPWFWLKREICDQVFIQRLKDPKFPPNFLFFPIALASRTKDLFSRQWQKAFTEYALNKYTSLELVQRHYNGKTRAYLDYSKLTNPQLLELYTDQKGRLGLFLKRNRQSMEKIFLNGDTFLDAGCGKGQNIKDLISLFPDSNIKGFDINEGALNVIRAGTKNSERIELEIGSFSDLKYLSNYKDNSIDHVIVCHVLAFLFAENIKTTTQLRQNIIDHLIRIARKSVLIIDGMNLLSEGNPTFEIEQRDRGFLRDFFPKYLEKHRENGELNLMFAEGSIAFHFTKNVSSQTKSLSTDAND